MDEFILICKFILWVAVLLVLALFLGHTEISINPFYIKVTAWRTVIGWIALFMGCSLILYDIRKEAYDEGYNDAEKEISNIIENVNSDKLPNKNLEINKKEEEKEI